MSLIPWRNKREGRPGEMSPMFALRSEVDRLFDSFLREPFSSLDWPLWRSDKWTPAVDVAENDKEVTVRAELPGIDPKDIDVAVSGNQLVLRGEKKETSEIEEKGFHQCETRYGSFHRTVPLPEGVDTENVDAQYAHGVLTLRLAKTAPAAAKRIEVKVK
ncbi:MAG: Hsp20/alpha crystallin family protein [Planctomycetes bacterium]|nr:Hsp20/alpha crystallin family protein [Planctomycetota bacterium]MBU4400798.1 Hsp20/alpha crystallin family protein [Planctomycetota bacterium]MCG2683196.1 Hsp20/alpha crystallin family protein [Planctomycetales bacterium]